MTVYVDDMFKSPMGRFGRMKMSHMVADTEAELLDMADKIGLSRRWLQCKGQGRWRLHFDVSMGYRTRAVEAGAVEMTMRDLARMTRKWQQEDTALSGASRGDAPAGCRASQTGRTLI